MKHSTTCHIIWKLLFWISTNHNAKEKHIKTDYHVIRWGRTIALFYFRKTRIKIRGQQDHLAAMFTDNEVIFIVFFWPDIRLPIEKSKHYLQNCLLLDYDIFIFSFYCWCPFGAFFSVFFPLAFIFPYGFQKERHCESR